VDTGIKGVLWNRRVRIQRRKFSREFKPETVKLVRARRLTMAQAARELDLHINVLRKWVIAHRSLARRRVDNGPVNAYITIDFGRSVALSSLTLYNTHNGPYGDRGTGNFDVFGGSSVTGGQIDAPTLVLSGTLAPQAINAPIAAQSFAASGTFRYISFNPTGVAVAGTSCCGTNNYGLNELRAFGAVPEPQSWAPLIAGFGMVGASMRRRALRAA
jgi:hypothetical protein